MNISLRVVVGWILGILGILIVLGIFLPLGIRVPFEPLLGVMIGLAFIILGVVIASGGVPRATG